MQGHAFLCVLDSGSCHKVDPQRGWYILSRPLMVIPVSESLNHVCLPASFSFPVLMRWGWGVLGNPLYPVSSKGCLALQVFPFKK